MHLINLFKSAIYQLKCSKLCNKIEDENKVKFEKEIIKLLKKFNLFNQDYSSLQKVTIIADVDKLPIVNIEYLIIDRSGIDKE